MPIEPTAHQEFDPDDDYEEIPFPPNPLLPGLPKQPGDSREGVYCCKCMDGDVTLCSAEGTFGHITTHGAAQGISFWLSPSC